MSENIVLRDKPSLVAIVVVWPVVALVLVVMFSILAAIFSSPLVGQIYTLMAALFVALCFLRLLADLVEREFTRYTLTTRQVSKEWGILRRDQTVIPLENVQVVTIRQALFGRILDYGTVIVQAAGLGEIRLRMVPRPHEWQQTILQSLPAKI